MNEDITAAKNVRLSGLLKLVAGGIVFTCIAAYFMNHGLKSGRSPFWIIIPAIPGAFALMGLIEVLTGLPASQVASAWDSLAGWQRGILGTLIVALAFVLMMAGIVLFA